MKPESKKALLFLLLGLALGVLSVWVFIHFNIARTP